MIAGVRFKIKLSVLIRRQRGGCHGVHPGVEFILELAILDWIILEWTILELAIVLVIIKFGLLSS